MQSKAQSFGLLPIRVLAGITFMVHGYPKLINPDKTAGFFTQIGLPVEMVIPIALLEFIGGLVLILGILTRIASILLIGNMIGATLLVKLQKGFVGGAELDLLLLSICLTLLIIGPGRISIEGALKREIFPKIGSMEARDSRA